MVLHGQNPRPSVLLYEVLVRQLCAVDRLAAVKSPPWHMNPGMIRWKVEPLQCSGFPLRPVPFSPLQRARKFSAVRGVMSAQSSITIRPAGDPPIAMSKNTLGFDIVSTGSRFNFNKLTMLYMLLLCLETAYILRERRLVWDWIWTVGSLEYYTRLVSSFEMF